MSEREPLIASEIQLKIPESEKTFDILKSESVENRMKKLFAIVLYATTSFSITVVNKEILTVYGFPSSNFLAFGQLFATIMILLLLHLVGKIVLPHFRSSLKNIFPLPIFYLGNLVFGLSSTKMLSLPMLTVLRRFSILMTMIGESLFLNMEQSDGKKLSVGVMILGSVVAAANDLTFNAKGYVNVTVNNLFTASNNVTMKKKLKAKELGKFGMLFYNAIFSIVILGIYVYIHDDITKFLSFPAWSDYKFATLFFLSCIMGLVLNFSIILMTDFGSPLLTTVIGCLKNILITYYGMIVGGDYIFDWLNFSGITMSLIGSLYFSYLALRRN